jgi:GNAT superfamily N-acetyltransferase
MSLQDRQIESGTQPTAKTARLEARVADDQKALFQRAADLAGRSLTDFVVSSAQEIATRTVHEREVLDAGVVPPEIAKRLPRDPLIPATLLGRLVVEERLHGEGIAQFLLMDALHRCRAQSGQIAAVAVVVEAIDEGAERFYQHFGFIPFRESQAVYS